MSKYKEKSVIVEAIQFNGSNFKEIAEAFAENDAYDSIEDYSNWLRLATVPYGHRPINVGDWFVKNAEGNLEMFDEAAFDARYVPQYTDEQIEQHYASALKAMASYGVGVTPTRRFARLRSAISPRKNTK